MSKVFNWIKTHKLLTFNLLVVAYLIFRFISYLGILGSPTMISGSKGGMGYGYDYAVTNEYQDAVSNVEMYREAPPQPGVKDRKVVLNSSFSLLVKNVTDTLDKIKQETLRLSGYVVTSDLNKGEYDETAVITLRVPSDKVEEMSKYLRGLAVKVVSENVAGNDVTDQYVDIERRMADLEKQRVRIEKILDSASTVSQMLEVQRALFQVQDEIDMYKGKLLYMDGTTQTSKLTVYISTDELSLPYTPDQPWRPEVVFKNAVRSLLTTLQSVGSFIIWIAVYAPLILVVVVVIKLIKRKKQP